MTCRACGAPDAAESVDLDRMLYAAAYRAGWTDAAGEGPAHPAVADSVARMFAGWDGADAAHTRSVARFHEWHAHAHRPEEVTQTDHAA